MLRQKVTKLKEGPHSISSCRSEAVAIRCGKPQRRGRGFEHAFPSVRPEGALFESKQIAQQLGHLCDANGRVGVDDSLLFPVILIR